MCIFEKGRGRGSPHYATETNKVWPTQRQFSEKCHVHVQFMETKRNKPTETKLILRRGAKRKFKNLALTLCEKLLSQNWLVAVGLCRQEATMHLNCSMLLS